MSCIVSLVLECPISISCLTCSSPSTNPRVDNIEIYWKVSGTGTVLDLPLSPSVRESLRKPSKIDLGFTSPRMFSKNCSCLYLVSSP